MTVLLVVLFGTMLVLRQPGGVHGHVYSWQCANGAALGQGSSCDIPASGIRLRFVEASTHRAFSTVTDAHGSYSIGLPGGRYTVAREWVGGSASMDAGASTIWIWPFMRLTIDYAVQGGASLH
jgi:hypothetical protein